MMEIIKNNEAIEAAEKGNAKLTDEQKLERSAKGKFQLVYPLKNNDKEIHELEFDFGAISAMEYVRAMKVDRDAQNAYRVTEVQALELFALAVSKSMPELSAADVKIQLKTADYIPATQRTAVFFNITSQAGAKRFTVM